jgi:hypothetical protein
VTIARIAFFDPRDLFDETGVLRKIPDLDSTLSAAIAQIEVEIVERNRRETVRRYRIKLHDKLRALEIVRRILESEGDERRKDRLREIVNAIQAGWRQPDPESATLKN